MSVLDAGAIEVIRSLSTPERNVLARVAAAYRSSTPALAEALREGVESGDFESVRRAAHSLRSSSGNVGALRVVELARRLERLEPGSEEGPKLLEELEAELLAVDTALENELAKGA